MGQKLIDLFKGEITGSESEEISGGKSAKSPKGGDYGGKTSSKGRGSYKVATKAAPKKSVKKAPAKKKPSKAKPPAQKPGQYQPVPPKKKP